MHLRFPGRRRRARGIVAAGVAVIGLAGLVLAPPAPVFADPADTLVAVGGDTTQGVYNQLALDVSGNLLGSYDATNPVTGAAHENITRPMRRSA